MRSLRFIAGLGLAGLASAIAAYMLLSYVQGVRQENAVALHAEEIFRSPDSFVAGNPEGDVSVVAFFDYNCPYCRQGPPALSRLIAADGKVRLVLKELPVLGADSEAVARIAQAAIAQGKYLELYERLIAEPGRATKDEALRLASELGLDTAKLEQDAQGPVVEGAIAANKRLADRLGWRVCPSISSATRRRRRARTSTIVSSLLWLKFARTAAAPPADPERAGRPDSVGHGERYGNGAASRANAGPNRTSKSKAGNPAHGSPADALLGRGSAAHGPGREGDDSRQRLREG